MENKTGRTVGAIVREEIDKARRERHAPGFMRLAGAVSRTITRPTDAQGRRYGELVTETDAVRQDLQGIVNGRIAYEATAALTERPSP